MKPVKEMTSAEKAAALLIAVGPDAASNIFKHLDEDTVYKITAEMSRIDYLSPEDREELLGDFMLDIRKIRGASFGGEEFAKRLLSDSFGDSKARQILKKVDENHIDGKFDFLNKIDPEAIATLISLEHPQIISVILSYLEKSKSGQVLKLLDREIAKEVAKRIAKMDRVVPEAVVEIARRIKKRHEDHLDDLKVNDKPGGISKLAEILNHVDGISEKFIMEYFESEMPREAAEIRNKIYSFENIIDLSNKEIRILIDEIGNDNLIAKSLKGAGDEIRFKILRNVSNNRAKDILYTIDIMGPVRLSEILDARQRIVNIMKDLNDRGVIVLRKRDEKLVE